MHISDEGKIGIVLALIGLAGAGAIMVAPQQLWIGWSLIALALPGFFWLLYNHMTASDKNKRVPAVFLVSLGIAFVLVGGVIGLIGAMQMDSQGERAQNANLTKAQIISLARRWLALANDINADLPPLIDGVRPEFRPELPFQQKVDLHQQQVELHQRNRNAQMNAMRGRYGGRITLAQSEMLKAGVLLDASMSMSPPVFVNAFSFERWANKLGAEGQRILIENGEMP